MFRLYQPCLPTRALKAPTGPLWTHEIKHGGFLIVARRVNGVVRLQTKQGYDYAERYPLIVEAILRLKVRYVPPAPSLPAPKARTTALRFGT